MKKSGLRYAAFIGLIPIAILFYSCIQNARFVPPVPTPPYLVYPWPCMLTVDDTIQARWDASYNPLNGKITYEVRLGRTPQELEVTPGFFTDASQYTLSDLEEGIWFWKVFAHHEKGTAHSSEVGVFTILGESHPRPADLREIPPHPLLFVTRIEDQSFSLEWNEYCDCSDPNAGIQYFLYIHSAPDSQAQQAIQTSFKGFDSKRGVPNTVTTELSHSFHGEKETLYEWIIIAQNFSGKETMVGYGHVMTGNDPPTQPALVYPVNYQKGIDSDLIFQWTSSNDRNGDIIQYQLYVDRFPFSNQCVGPGSRILKNQHALSLLEPGITYYWFVMAFDPWGGASKSEMYQFQTMSSTIGFPENPYPEDRSEGIEPDDLFFSWEVEGEPESASFTLLFGLDPRTLTPIATSLSGSSHQTDLSLDERTTYFWQIEVAPSHQQETNHQKTTGPIWSFTTAKRKAYAVPEISLSFPANHATQVPRTLTLKWEVAAGELINTDVGNHPTITENRVYFTKEGVAFGDPEITTKPLLLKEGLAYATTYLWKVEAIQSDGQSSMSPEFRFSTVSKEYGPPAIHLVHPTDGSKDQPRELTLQWMANVGEPINSDQSRDPMIIEYRVFFAEAGSGFGEPESTGELKWRKEGLAYGTTYFWKVEAVQSDGKVGTSPIAEFTTIVHPIQLHRPGGVARGYDRLSMAIEDAQNGDWITVRGGHRIDDEQMAISIRNKELIIRSEDETPFVVDMGSRDRAFHITEGASVTFHAIILTGGYTEEDGGGGVFIENSRLFVHNGSIIENIAGNHTNSGYGGGVYVSGHEALFYASHTVFASNTALGESGYGGAICIGKDAMGVLSHCALINNRSGNSGGAIYSEGVLAVEDTQISRNWADSYGGGVFIDPNASPSRVFSCHFLNNGAGIEGGGVFVGTGALVENALGMPWNVHLFPGTTISAIDVEGDWKPNEYSGNHIRENPNTNGAHVFFSDIGFHPIFLFDAGDHFQDVYEDLHTAIAESEDQFRIFVRGGMTFFHSSQILVAAKEITIASFTDEPFIIDMGGHPARAFEITSGASVTLWNARIQNANHHQSGGAFFIGASSQLTVKDCLIHNNHTKGNGGAVFVTNGVFQAIRTTISHNSAIDTGSIHGGGVYITGANSRFIADASTISHNQASGFGGALYTGGNTQVTCRDTVISNNRAQNGGGVYVRSGILSIDQTVIEKNAATSIGGGIFRYTGSIRTQNTNWETIPVSNTSLSFSIDFVDERLVWQQNPINEDHSVIVRGNTGALAQLRWE